MISVTAPIQSAVSRTQRILFRPFQAEKWLALGFCAFLANLGGGGGGNYRFNGNPFAKGTQPHLPALDTVSEWLSAHLALVVTLGILLLLCLFALGVLFLWLSARGQFMFLEGVLRNQAEVVEPWHRFKEPGNSLFVLRLYLNLGLFGALLLLGALAWFLARPDIAARQFGASALMAVLICGGLFLLLAIPLAVVGLLLNDFAVPIMARRGIPASQAFGVLWREVMPGHGPAFVLFYLMKLVLALGAALIIVMGTCLTCCIAALPYVSSVVFLPIFVFFRSYSLYFLEQFSGEWRLMEEG